MREIMRLIILKIEVCLYKIHKNTSEIFFDHSKLCDMNTN